MSAKRTFFFGFILCICASVWGAKPLGKPSSSDTSKKSSTDGQCKPANAAAIAAAENKVKAVETRASAKHKNAAEKARADREVAEAKAELAKLECKSNSTSPTARVPNGVKQTGSSVLQDRGRPGLGSITNNQKSSPGKKGSVAAAKSGGRSKPSASSTAGSCQPAEAKTIAAARQKLDHDQRIYEGLAKDANASAAQKAAAKKTLDQTKAELAKLQCKSAA